MEGVVTLSCAVVKARTLCLQHSPHLWVLELHHKKGCHSLPWGISELLGAAAL